MSRMSQSHGKSYWVLPISFCLILCIQAYEPLQAEMDEPVAGVSDVTYSADLSEQRLGRTLFRFVENRGQLADTEGNPVPEILYYADAGGAKLYFQRDRVSIVFMTIESSESGISEATGRSLNDESDAWLGEKTTSYHRVDMLFVGGNSGTFPQAAEVQPGYTNYYYAHCPKGITHVPGYAELTYVNIYENIDLRFQIVEGRLKYEFIVHPGGRVEDIRLRYDGATDLFPTLDGGMDISTPLGTIRESAPLTFQDPTERIASAFILDDNELGFAVTSFDGSADLTIDPWVTYYGGSNNEGVRGLAVDGSDNVILGGGTQSTDFPVSQAIQATYAGGAYDAYIVKLNAAGVLQWATFYGGTEGEGCSGVSANATGTIAVAGVTHSANFPIKSAVQSTYSGNGDSFVVKLQPSGTVLWATYFGGALTENHGWCAIDGMGAVFGGTRTTSGNFPTKNAFQNAHAGGGHDIAVFRLSSSGTLEWSTFYGGSSDDLIHGMSVDINGNVLFCGPTKSADIPLVNPVHGSSPVGQDLVIARMSASGSLIWATLYGGNGAEYASEIACGPDAIVSVTARTWSTDLPVRNAIQSSAVGNGDALVAVYDSSGRFIMGSYLGGSNGDVGNGIAFDPSGKIVVCGQTESADYPLLVPQQATLAGSPDAFITRFDTSGVVDWSTFYGGSQADDAVCVEVNKSGGVIVAGSTASDDVPLLNPIQSTNAGMQDIMILSLFSSGGTLTPPDPPSNLTGAPLTHTKAQLN
ncbi:MAG: hypothetical protein C0600_08880 [Ignavibacteria bacterium]|nr:MAG: hypothetical protein C0600_08880 [Ignavibacteria bacterium]